MTHRLVAFAAAVLAAPLSAPAQVRTLALEGPDAAVPDAFSAVRGVRELSSGRLLVADWIEERVVAVDLATGDLGERVGRGPGPDEVRLPSALVPMPGDSTLLVDLGNARLAILDPAGRVARTLRAERPGLTGVGGVDAEGGLWYAVPGWAAGAEPLPDDSVRLVRLDPALGTSTTMAVIQGSRRRRDRSPSREPRIPVVGFASRDGWALLPDGRLAVVRTGPYHLEVVGGGGRTTRGPALVCQGAPVTQDDREAFVRAFLASSPMSGRGADGGMGHAPSADDAQVRRMVATAEFADTHPCFDAGEVLAGADGTVWVGRGGSPGGAPAAYDVFDGDGGLVASVTLPEGRRVVAVGHHGVYAVVTGALGLQSLERYPRPIW